MRIGRLAGLTLILAAWSYADVITFTHTGVGSGTIGATTFTNVAFTITDTGNTLDRVSFGNGFFIDDTSATIDLSGVGIFTFLTGTRTFVNNSVSVVGFSRATTAGLDLFNGPSNAAFGTYDLLSSIGPISGVGNLLQWNTSPVDTTGGVLNFNNGSSDTVFTARVGVPEPSSTLLLGFGLGIAALARLRLRRSI